MYKDDKLIRLFADRLKELRQSQNLSQKGLSEKAGICFRYIGFIEQARINPTMDTLAKVARGLGREPSDLFPARREICPEGRPPTERELILAKIAASLSRAGIKKLGKLERTLKILAEE